MEIYGQAVDATTGQPIPGATCQRLYPGGQIYSDPIIANNNGVFNGRVPDRTYKWLITSVGYNPVTVDGFPDSVVSTGDNPTVQVTVKMIAGNAQELDPVTVTPSSGKSKVLLYAGIAAIGVFAAKHYKLI